MGVLQALDRMSDERFHALYEALSERGFGPLDGEIARHLKFRPQSIKKLPLTTRSKRARQLLAGRRDADLTYEFFGQYLLKTRKELVTGFLDATGVPHDEGMIQSLTESRPEDGKVAAAVADLDGKFDPEDVTLYLALCAQHWPEVESLGKLWDERSGAATT